MAGGVNTKHILAVNDDQLHELLYDGSLRVYIDGYTYTAITGRSATIKCGITSVSSENGLNRSDNAYNDPMTMSFTILVSKLDRSEYNRLYTLYSQRKVVNVRSIAYNCENALMSSFEITDEYIDVIEIGVSFIEVLVSSKETNVPRFISPYQLSGGSNNVPNKVNADNTSQLQQDETASLDNSIKTQERLKNLTVVGMPTKMVEFKGVIPYGAMTNTTYINPNKSYDQLLFEKWSRS